MSTIETRDRHFQAFVDWARTASVPVMLEHVAFLMRWEVNPHCENSMLHESLRHVAKVGGWGEVLALIADVQREREARAA